MSTPFPTPAVNRRLASQTWQQIAGRNVPPTIAIPLGSCEQHGPHLPLDTDARIATALAEHLARERDDVLVGPTLPFGSSWEHDGFPGLLSLNHEVIAGLLVELAHSADWAAGLVFINGHGGNWRGIHEGVQRIRLEGRQALGWSPRLADGDPHAGLDETSIMLALAPELVDRSEIRRGWVGPLDTVMQVGVRAVSRSGVLGDPTRASVSEGRALLADFGSQLLDAYDGWQR